MRNKILVVVLILFLGLIFVGSGFADLYIVNDKEGKNVCITNISALITKYRELCYTLILVKYSNLKLEEKTPTLDSLVESQIEEPKLDPEKEKAKKEAEAKIKAQIKELEDQSKTEIKILDWTNYRSGNYCYVEGILKNVGKGIARYVQVKVIAYDKYKKLVTLKESYANPYNLSPGQEATFKVMIKYNERIDNFGLRVNWE